MKFFLISIIVCVLSMGHNSASAQEKIKEWTLKMKIIGIEKSVGKIMIAIYDTKKIFGTEQHYREGIYVVDDASWLICEIKMPFGEYAASVFQDTNSNDKFDTNFLGIPTENYGFSNNARNPFGIPKYEEAEFTFSTENQTIEIELKPVF